MARQGFRVAAPQGIADRLQTHGRVLDEDVKYPAAHGRVAVHCFKQPRKIQRRRVRRAKRGAGRQETGPPELPLNGRNQLVLCDGF